MSRGHRQTELHERRVRASKLALLRKRYATATSQTDREAVFEKVRLIAPWLSLDEFLLKKKRETKTP